MSPEELVDRFPRLHHVTEAGAWDSIQRHGLLSTSALLDLFEVDEHVRYALEARPRPESVAIGHPVHGQAVIRDNKPLRLGILERCLDGTVEDWCRTLNRRVFFWATEHRLANHLRARGHRGQRRDVVTVSTERLLERIPEAVTLCPINSGSTLYPNAPRRGPDTFTPVESYPFDEMRRRRGVRDAVVEVCVDRALYDASDVVDSVITLEADGTRTRIA